MAKGHRDETPEEMPAIKTTIVGGRPPGCGKPVGEVPRGIEVLVKKASIDRLFREKLLEMRSACADLIGLSLTPTEKTMLDSIPEKQLVSIINNTKVQPGISSAFMTYTAAIMLAALGCTAPLSKATTEDVNVDGGARPDVVDRNDRPSSEYWTDSTNKIRVKAGVLSGILIADNGENPRGSITIVGKVHDENTGKELSVHYSVESDSDGYFRMDPAPSGSFIITASSGGFVSQNQPNILIPSGGMIYVSLSMIPAPTRGISTDLPNRPTTTGISPK